MAPPRTGRTRRGAAVLVAVLLAGACGAGPDAGAPPSPDDRVAAVGPDPRAYDPWHPPVPLTSVVAGGGRIELVGLWRQGPFVRLAVAAATDGDADTTFAGRFGPLLRPLAGALLVVAPRRTAHPVLTGPPPEAGGPGDCLCSPEVPTARPRALYHADFRVPETVDDVLVLGDAVPPFGRVRIAHAVPDLAGAGYRWPSGPPPELGRRPFDESLAAAPILDLVDVPPDAPPPGAAHDSVTLPTDGLVESGALAGLAGRLRDLPAGTTVTVVGHTDGEGAERVNLELSRQRARAAADELRARLDRRDLTVQSDGRGEQEPIAPDGDPAGRARNRRVEIRVPRAAAAALAQPLRAPSLPADAPRLEPRPGEVAAVEVAPERGSPDRVRIAVEAARTDPDLRLVRVDLRLELTAASGRSARSTRAGEALAEPDASRPAGLRHLRLVDPRTGARAHPSADDLDHCLCPDQLATPLTAGAPERLSVWFPVPAAGTTTVSLLIPRAGLLRDLPLN